MIKVKNLVKTFIFLGFVVSFFNQRQLVFAESGEKSYFNAEFYSQSNEDGLGGHTVNINSGDMTFAEIKLENTGSQIWYPGLVNLGVMYSNREIDANSDFIHQSWFSPDWHASPRAGLLGKLVFPGEIGTFGLILDAEKVHPDQYKIYFAPVAEGIEWFGREIGLSFTVNVLPARADFDPPMVEVNSELNFLWPTEGRITQYFGETPFSYNCAEGIHTGIDIANQVGSPIYAIESGTVISADWGEEYGYSVRIDHGDGLVSIYGQLSKISLQAGDYVEKGQLIADMGSTGWSTGPHLHFEMRLNDEPFNPLDLEFENLSQ